MGAAKIKGAGLLQESMLWPLLLLLPLAFAVPDTALRLTGAPPLPSMDAVCRQVAAIGFRCTSKYDGAAFGATDMTLAEARARIGALLNAPVVTGLDVLQDPSAGYLHSEETARAAPKADVALAYRGRKESARPPSRALLQATVGLPKRRAAVQLGAPYHLSFLNSRQRPCQFGDDAYVFEEDGRGVRVYVVGESVNGDHVAFDSEDPAGARRMSNDTYAPPDFLPRATQVCAQWQGTHVAALAAGLFHGVAKGAEVVSVVVKPGCRQVSTARALADGLQWVLRHDARAPAGRAVAVISTKVSVLGANTVAVDIIEDLVRALLDAGVVVVTGAGSGSVDACNFTPGRMPGVVTVSGAEVVRLPSKAIGRPWDYTNAGRCVTLWAQAASMESAFAPGRDATAVYSGTSQAAGLTAGVVAALLQRYPDDSVATTVERLINVSSTAYLMYSLPDTVESILQLPVR